jgi:hypothetical protein
MSQHHCLQYWLAHLNLLLLLPLPHLLPVFLELYRLLLA